MPQTTNHTFLPDCPNDYVSPHHQRPLKTIANPNPHMLSEQTHVVTLPELCPASHNPGPGSSMSIRYQAGAHFLELFALEAYFKGYIGHPIVRDIEYLTQEVAKDCAAALGISVTVTAHIFLAGLAQQQILTTTAPKPIRPAPSQGE